MDLNTLLSMSVLGLHCTSPWLDKISSRPESSWGWEIEMHLCSQPAWVLLTLWFPNALGF